MKTTSEITIKVLKRGKLAGNNDKYAVTMINGKRVVFTMKCHDEGCSIRFARGLANLVRDNTGNGTPNVCYSINI